MSGPMPLGYYKDPEKSAATFRIIDGVRYTIPGDFATVDADGTVRLLGRGSQCINTGGEKVYPEEVEEVLKLHHACSTPPWSACPTSASAKRSRRWSSSAAGPALDEAALIAHVKGRLAAYKAPKRVITVAVGRTGRRTASSTTRR